MELNTTLVISFLVLVIIILIFSKITIGTDDDESKYLENKLSQFEEKIKEKININTVSPQSSLKSIDNTNTDDNLLSDEFKKQLQEMENRFYYDNCRYNKS
jgi:hypothetical protein